MTDSKEYILWLPSWYPNEFEPYNGDFIQRHAIATSNYCKIVVFHFMQLGASFQLNNNYFKEDDLPNLTEYRIAPSFVPTGNKLIDKILYNYKYYQYSKKVLTNFFEKNGLPKTVHVHVPLKAGILALWIKRKYKINYIVSEQASHYMEISPDSFFKKNTFHKNRVRKIFAESKIVTNVSATIGEKLREIFNLKNVITIYNTVNTELFYFEHQINHSFVYLHVSSLTEQKNVFGMLNAFESFYKTRKDWRLQIIGPFHKEIEELIKQKGLNNNVEIVGEISYSLVAKYMQRASVFVLFSNHENFPCVVVESLCCGLPVIASDVAGIKEAINSENGILVNSQNEDELLAALMKIKENYNTYDKMSISNSATSKYNYQVIGKKFFNLYCNTQFP